MLDIKLVREKSNFVELAIARRNGGFSIKPLLACDEEFRQVQNEWEELNRRTNEISQAFKTGNVPADKANALKEETKTIKSHGGKKLKFCVSNWNKSYMTCN